MTCQFSDGALKAIVSSLIVALVVGHGSPVFAQLDRDSAIAKAEAILKNFQDGTTADIVKEFDAKLTQELPEAKLKPVWSGVVAQFGAFKGLTERREGQMQGRQAVELILAFEKETAYSPERPASEQVVPARPLLEELPDQPDVTKRVDDRSLEDRRTWSSSWVVPYGLGQQGRPQVQTAIRRFFGRPVVVMHSVLGEASTSPITVILNWKPKR